RARWHLWTESGNLAPQMRQIKGLVKRVDRAVTRVDPVLLVGRGENDRHAPRHEHVDEVVNLLAEQLDVQDRPVEPSLSDDQIGVMYGWGRPENVDAMALEVIAHLARQHVVVL